MNFLLSKLKNEPMSDIPLDDENYLTEWVCIIQHPSWEMQKGKAIKLLNQYVKNLWKCTVCLAVCQSSNLAHKPSCKGRFLLAGISPALEQSVNYKHHQSIALIKHLSLKENKCIMPAFFVEMARKAVVKECYSVIVEFGYQWLYGLSKYSEVSEKIRRDYISYVVGVIKKIYSPLPIDGELGNVTNASYLLDKLLPSNTGNVAIWGGLIGYIDRNDLLPIVGYTKSSRT